MKKERTILDVVKQKGLEDLRTYLDAGDPDADDYKLATRTIKELLEVFPNDQEVIEEINRIKAELKAYKG